eukprot:1156476-Pelagomonas_calceolata.AAC.6
MPPDAQNLTSLGHFIDIIDQTSMASLEEMLVLHFVYIEVSLICILLGCSNTTWKMLKDVTIIDTLIGIKLQNQVAGSNTAVLWLSKPPPVCILWHGMDLALGQIVSPSCIPLSCGGCLLNFQTKHSVEVDAVFCLQHFQDVVKLPVQDNVNKTQNARGFSNALLATLLEFGQAAIPDQEQATRNAGGL